MNDFMNGRYGADDLTTALGILGMVLAFIGTLASWKWLSLLGLIIVVVALARALSKNHAARERENAMYLELIAKVPGLGEHMGGRAGAGAGKPRASMGDLKRQASTAKKMWKDRKVKAFLKCPTCGTTLAVPKGKGRMIVTCPKCKTKMETRS